MITRVPSQMPAPVVPPLPEWEAAAARYGVRVAARDADAIRAYLETRPELVSRFDEAFRVARDEFPAPASLILRFYRDREYPDEYIKLCAWGPEMSRPQIREGVHRVAERHGDVFADLPDFLNICMDFEYPKDAR